MSANEGDGAPPRDNLLNYSLCKKLVLLSHFSFSGNAFNLDFFDNLLAIYPSIVVATSAPAFPKLNSIISLLYYPNF